MLAERRVILLVDLDYFFAQCEERENPSLRGKPVVVCVYSARGGDSGAIGTANYVARKFGVRSGMPIGLAKKLLENREAVFLPVNKEFYKQVSDRIMSLLRKHADRFEQVSIDEAFLDVTQRVNGSFDRGKTQAKQIKNEVLAREGLTCSVGVGPNKLVAKIAAGHGKPDGLVIVYPDEVKEFLSPLPVGELPGVGRKTEKIMVEMGVRTIGDLAEYRVEDLMRDFGKTVGAYFHNASNGVDVTPVQERESVKQIGRITTLKEDTRDLNVVLADLHRLCEDVYASVLKSHLSFKNVGVMAVMENLEMRTRSTTLESPTNAINIMKTCSKELLETLLRESELKIRRIGVRVSSFVEGFQQRELKDFL